MLRLLKPSPVVMIWRVVFFSGRGMQEPMVKKLCGKGTFCEPWGILSSGQPEPALVQGSAVPLGRF